MNLLLIFNLSILHGYEIIIVVAGIIIILLKIKFVYHKRKIKLKYKLHEMIRNKGLLMGWFKSVKTSALKKYSEILTRLTALKALSISVLLI